MKLFKFLLPFLLLLGSITATRAQITEGTACTAICMDPTKSVQSGRQPSQNNVSPNLNLPCGSGTSEDNPMWWILRPKGDKLTFIVNGSNCVAGGCGLGLQMTLWEGDNCGAVTAIDCVVPQGAAPSAVLSTPTQPCKTYYLQIDGLCECRCDITLTYDKSQILQEVKPPQITGPKQICSNTSAKFSANLVDPAGCRPDGYKWTVTPAGSAAVTGTGADVTVRVTNPPASGKVQICAEPTFKGKCTVKTTKACVELEILDMKPATCDVKVCPEDRPLIYELIDCIKTKNPTFTGEVKPETFIIGNSFLPGTTKTQIIDYKVIGSDCPGKVTLNVTIPDNKPTELPPVLLCETEKRIVKGTEFTCADAGAGVKTIQKLADPSAKPNRCDSIFKVLVQCIKVKPSLVGGGVLDCSTKSLTLNAASAGTVTLPVNVTLPTYAGVGKREYAWSKDGVIIPGATAATQVVTAPGTYEVTLSYTYEVTMSSGTFAGKKYTKTCTATKSIVVTGTTAGDPTPETPVANSEPCQNDTASYCITKAVGASYKWTVTGGATILGGPGSDTLSCIIVKNVGAPYKVCLTKTACGKTSATPTCIDITPIPPPVVPVITGKTPVCQGDSAVIYKITPYKAGTTYKWTITNGTVIEYNNDTTQVSVKWSKTAISGDVSVTVKDRCGSATGNLPIAINSLPEKPKEISGKKAVCIGANEPYIVTPSQFATGYSWTLSSNSGTLSSTTGGTVSVTWTTLGTHQLCVKATNDCSKDGSEEYCIDVVVSDYPKPDAGSNRKSCNPQSSKLGGKLSTPGNTGKWTKVSGPGNVTFTDPTVDSTNVAVTVCGVYQLAWTESNGLCEASDTMEITVSEPPRLKKFSYTCNPVAKTYVVTLELEGCLAPYSLVGSKYPGTVTGNIVTIPNVPETDTSWAVTVANSVSCINQIPIKADCNCETRAGEMNIKAPMTACEKGGSIQAEHKGNYKSDGNDVIAYVLHEGSGGSIFNDIAYNKTGLFTFDPVTMQCGKPYYISLVIGNPGTDGNPDPADKCLRITPQGQQVSWDCVPKPIAGTAFEVCGLTATMAATTPATGVTGQWTGLFVSIDDKTNPNAKITVDKAGIFTFTWVETNGTCKDSSKVAITFKGGNITPTTPIYKCNSTNDNYDATFKVAGGTAPYTILDAAGTVIGTINIDNGSFTVANIISGEPFTVRITDVNKCDTITLTDSHLCGCTTAAGTLTILKPEVCVGTNIVATVVGAVKDGNDIEEFVLAEGCNTKNAKIIARNTTGTFSFDAATMTCDKTYKLVYLIGNKSTTGDSVSQSDKCLKTICRDVKFICVPEATASVVSVDTCALTATLQAGPGTNGKWTLAGGKTATFTPSVTSPNVVASGLTFGDYTFIWTEDNDGCTDTAEAKVTIVKKGNLGYTVDTLCATTGKDYVLRFTLTGAAPFILDPSSTKSGIFAGNVFTTETIVSGSKVKFCFKDALVCTPLCAEFAVKCPCLTNAGQMAQAIKTACVDATITVVAPLASTGVNLDGDDTAEFFLHTKNGADGTLGSVIEHNTTGEFTFKAPMVAGTTYYVSYVVGDKSSTNPNEVDLNDGCLSVSLGQPIVFNALPTATIGTAATVCKGSTAPIQIDMTGKAPFEIIYTANGTPEAPLTLSQNAYTLPVKPDLTTVYAFTRIKDDNGCVTNLTSDIEIKVNQPVSAGIPSPDVRYCLGTDITIDLEAALNNEDPGGTWSVSPAVLFTPSTANFQTKTAPVGAYTFTYTVKGTAPCPNASQNYKVLIDLIPVADAGPKQDLNCDASEVKLGGPTTSTGSSIVYQWLTLQGTALANTKAKEPTTRKPGIFAIEVRDTVTTCLSRDTVEITNNINFITGFTSKSIQPNCAGQDNGALEILKIQGGTPNYQYSINNGPFNPYKNFPNLKAGSYPIKVKDSKGCSFDTTLVVVDPEEIKVELPDGIDLDLGQDYTILAQINFADSLLKRVVWTPSCDSCLTDPKIKSLTYKVKPNETTLYTATVYNKRGCVSTDNILIRVNKPRRVYVPNTLFPDSDNDANRKLRIYMGIDVLKITNFRIYDRWGNQVYEDLEFTRRDAANDDRGWDGRYRNQPSLAGVYTYSFLVEFVDGYKEVYKGDVLLLDK